MTNDETFPALAAARAKAIADRFVQEIRAEFGHDTATLVLMTGEAIDGTFIMSNYPNRRALVAAVYDLAERLRTHDPDLGSIEP